jgi:hypothetical protein
MTRCPGIGERDDPDRCRTPVPASRGCRNHSHANSATDHLAYSIESGNADAQFQATARAGRVVFHRILEGITSSQANMVIGEGIAKRDRPLTAHHMITRRDQHDNPSLRPPARNSRERISLPQWMESETLASWIQESEKCRWR